MIVSFSFLSLLKSDYITKIKEFNNLVNDDWVHFDVMDGKFVNNKTFDYHLVNEINEYNHLFSDVHLMIEKPHRQIKKYYKAGAKQITFHYETMKENKILKVIKQIKKYGLKVGISIKPDTKVEVLDKYLSKLDYILIMSVEPGKGGQAFLDNSLDKIKYLSNKQKLNHYLIGVDGGINDKTVKLVKKAGADVVVVGTYLASNLNLETIEKLKAK